MQEPRREVSGLAPDLDSPSARFGLHQRLGHHLRAGIAQFAKRELNRRRDIMAKATFGAGCFWGVESAFRQVPGVTDVAVGYSGGATEGPTYSDASSGRTGP